MPTSIRDAPLISVIVLNWNGAAHLPRCLDALSNQTCRDFEGWVLDNASTDGSVDEVEQRWPAFRLVRFERNYGFARGNTMGAARARGHWLAFLNNDAFPEPEWLERLAQAAAEHPEFNFFASKLVDAGNPGLLQAAGDALHAGGAAWPLHAGEPSDRAGLQAAEVFSASAAAMMVQRQAFHAAGGFSAAFGSHLEDVDLGFRLRLRGGRGRYVPGAVVAHLGSASYGRESERTVYQVQRNLVWLYAANMPGRLVWKYLPAHLCLNLFFLIYYSLRGRGKAVWRAKRDALHGLPDALRRRRQIQAERTVEPAEIDRRLDHGWFSPYLRGRKGAALRRLAGRDRHQK